MKTHIFARFGGFFTGPYLLLTLAPLFWGGNIVAGKLAVGQVDPYFFVVARWTGALLLLAPFALPAVKRDWPVLRGSLPILAFYGMLGFGTFNLLMYLAAHTTAAINASIEQAAIPVFVLLANFVIFRVRAHLTQIAGLIVTIVGVAVVASHGDLSRLLALDVNIGDGLVIIACVAYAAYSLTLRYRPDVGWLSFIFVTAAFALLVSLIYQVLIGGFVHLPAQVAEVTQAGWFCVLYVMIFPSIVAQVCYARGVQMVGPNRASIFINLLPLFGALGSIAIIGETLSLYHVVAVLLVVCGIVMAEWSVRGAAPEA